MPGTMAVMHLVELAMPNCPNSPDSMGGILRNGLVWRSSLVARGRGLNTPMGPLVPAGMKCHVGHSR